MLDGKRRIVILDYKTGDYSLPKKTINRDCLSSRRQIKKAIGSFQLPIYIYLFSEFKKIPASKVQASFYSLREIKEEFLYSNGDSGKLLEIYLIAVERILSEVMSPNVDFERDDSNEYYCSWCPFSSSCKR